MLVLFSAPRDCARRPARYRDECLAVRRACEARGVACAMEAATTGALLRALGATAPAAVVHFVGSGTPRGQIVIESDEGKRCDLDPGSLRILAADNGSTPRPVVVVSAQGAGEAREAAAGFLSVGAPAVVLIPELALDFVQAFYANLIGWPDAMAPLHEVVARALGDVDAPEGTAEILTADGVAMLDVDVNRAGFTGLRLPPIHRTLSALELPEAMVAPKHFFGRKQAVEDLCNALLNDEEKRLLLITGMPGSGKSALASHVVQFALERRRLRSVSHVDCSALDRRIYRSAPDYRRARLNWVIAIASAIADEVRAQIHDHDHNHYSQQQHHQPPSGNSLQVELEDPQRPNSNKVIKQLTMALKELFEALKMSGRSIVLVLDNCEAAGLANSDFVDLLKGLTEYLEINVICISRYASPFLTISRHLVHVVLEGMVPDAARSMMQHVLGDAAPTSRSLALLSAVEQVDAVRARTPQMIAAVAREAAGDLEPNQITRLCTTAQERVLASFRKLLCIILPDRDAEAGVIFWVQCCERVGDQIRNPSRTTWERFKAHLQAHFKQSVGGNRGLSDHTVEVIGRNLDQISPRLPGKLNEHVAVSRFIKAFWPWYVHTLCTITRLGELWARRAGTFPVIWVISRDETEKRLATAQPGTFLLRLSERFPGALVVHCVANPGSRNRQPAGHGAKKPVSYVAHIRPDGTCLLGNRTYNGLTEAIVQNPSFKCLYAETRGGSLPKEVIFVSPPPAP